MRTVEQVMRQCDTLHWLAFRFELSENGLNVFPQSVRIPIEVLFMTVDASMEYRVHSLVVVGICCIDAFLNSLNCCRIGVVKGIFEHCQCDSMDFGWLESVQHPVSLNHAKNECSDQRLFQCRPLVEVNARPE